MSPNATFAICAPGWNAESSAVPRAEAVRPDVVRRSCRFDRAALRSGNTQACGCRHIRTKRSPGSIDADQIPSAADRPLAVNSASSTAACAAA